MSLKTKKKDSVKSSLTGGINKMVDFNSLKSVITTKVVAGVISGIVVAGSVGYIVSDLKDSVSGAEKQALEIKSQLESSQKSLADFQKLSDDSSKALSESLKVQESLKADYEKALNESLAKDSRIVSLEAEKTVLEQPKIEPSILDLFSEDGFKLGQNISITLDDADLSKLKEGKIKFDGTNYKYHEELTFKSPMICFSAHPSCDKEYGDIVRLAATEKGWLDYAFKFDEAIDRSKIADDESLELPFFGGIKTLRIVEATNTSVTVQPGEEVILKVGEEKLGVKLLAVFDEAVSVQVNDVQKYVKEGKTQELGNISVYLDKALSTNKDSSADYASLFIGDGGKTDFDNGDNFYLWGGDKSLANFESPWVWSITSTSIGIKHNLKYYDKEALKLGQEISLPAGFLTARVELKSKEPELVLDLDFDRAEIDGNVAVTVLSLESSDENGFKWSTDTGDRIVYDGESFKVYNDVTDKYDNITELKLKDSGLFVLNSSATEIKIDDFTVKFNLTTEKFTDVLVDGKSLDGRDEPVLNHLGFRIERVDDVDDLTDLKLVIPEKAPEFVLKLK